jgi:hypothetical protein
MVMVDPGHFVPDHGIEALRKSIIPIPNYPQEYQVRAYTFGFISLQAITDQDIGISTTRKTVGDTEVRFPLTPATINPNRKAFSITNKDEINSIYFHVKSTFTAGWDEGGTEGPKELGPGETFNSPIAGAVFIYIKCESGKSAKVEFAEYV